MKLFPTIATLALLSVGSTAIAVPIQLETVGGADTLVDWASLSSSGDASERAFIAGYLGVSADSITYTHLSSAASGGESGAWDTVIGNDSLYAFDFGALSPALFLIRTGNGVGIDGITGTFSHFLYQNVNAQNYGVIDLSLFTRSQGQIEIDMISHVSTSGTATSVPEPATLGLFGLALAGIGFARRRAQKA
jgi:hypothetical protein